MMPEANVQQLMADPAARLKHLAEQFPRCSDHIASLKKRLEDKPFAADLIDYLIKEFISCNDPCAEQIIRAVDLLKEEDSREVISAIKKAARAIYKNRINIFFSYKLKDEDVATTVVKQIRGVSDSKLNITYAKEFESGRDYRENILRTTRNAHWFILLLPDPTEDWDWCLYESGLFRAKKFPGDRLICIHHKDNKIPDQISNFHAVPATEERLKIFLNELFCQPDPVPGMDPVNKAADIETIAKSIAQAVSPPSSLKTVPFHDFVSVSVSDHNPLATNDDLNEMKIVDCTAGRLASFGKGERPATWGELTDNVIDAEDDHWRTELRRAIRAAREKNIPNEIHSTFAGYNGKHYRPILHAKEQAVSTGFIHSFMIDFVEDISAIDRSSLPKGLSVLAAALRIAVRFRWEVLENKRFQDHVMCEEEADEIRVAIDRILLEATKAGLEEEPLKAQFSSDADKKKIDEMVIHWGKMMNHEGTGELDEALRNCDAQKVTEMLQELAPINKEFLSMVSARFTEVLAD